MIKSFKYIPETALVAPSCLFALNAEATTSTGILVVSTWTDTTAANFAAE